MAHRTDESAPPGFDAQIPAGEAARPWWCVQEVTVGIVVATFVFAAAALLSGHSDPHCDLS